MAFENEPAAEHAYAYWRGWQAAGCAILFFGLIGSIGVSLIPAGYEKVQAGQLPTGIALLILGVLGIPTLLVPFFVLFAGIRDTFRPPLLRVTATALVLPEEARGEPPQDEDGEPVSEEPPHPQTIPFATIRWVRRGGTKFNHTLEVAYEPSESPVRIEKHMMRPADFDALEAVLRAALPVAFLNAPPPEPGTGG